MTVSKYVKGEIKRESSAEDVETQKVNKKNAEGFSEVLSKQQEQLTKKQKKAKNKQAAALNNASKEDPSKNKASNKTFSWKTGDIYHRYVTGLTDDEEEEEEESDSGLRRARHSQPRNSNQQHEQSRNKQYSKGERIQGSSRSSTKSKRSSRASKRKETKFGVFLKKCQESCSHYLVLITSWLINLLIDVSAMSAALMIHLGRVVVQGSMERATGLWAWVKRRYRCRGGPTLPPPPHPATPLTHNIVLPTTGEDAMKRLLSCKGKDPYSILGLTSRCTDEEIRRYYRSQALLVHPDKNSQPGAEEAFKILVHAFDLIAEPDKRAAYDRYVAETNQVEQAWSELSELLTQLHEKMHYAATTIRCNNCGKRHKRVLTERPLYAARFCSQCNIHHSAKEGDMWCEYGGWLWSRVYLACMEGSVYEMTEWARCQGGGLADLEPHAHLVHYRVLLGQPNHSQPQSGTQPAPDGDFDDLLSSLYGQSGSGQQRHRNPPQRKKKKAK